MSVGRTTHSRLASAVRAASMASSSPVSVVQSISRLTVPLSHPCALRSYNAAAR
ncbi:hypothetical protein ACFFX0_00645 [Citricoccus parietis]|uniref:Uncharacterized protein n=1 Tax=Citricoccus parietis TaxID=592307 RepID=A0ABV5FSX0_9MICC